MLLEANQPAGRRRLLIADHPWAPQIAEDARGSGCNLLKRAPSRSMVSAGEEYTAPVEIKAVSPGTLRGGLSLLRLAFCGCAPATGIPESGTVWLTSEWSRWILQVGESMNVGRYPVLRC